MVQTFNLQAFHVLYHSSAPPMATKSFPV